MKYLVTVTLTNTEDLDEILDQAQGVFSELQEAKAAFTLALDEIYSLEDDN